MAVECINQSTLYIVSSGNIALLRGRVASILHRFQFICYNTTIIWLWNI